MRKRLFLIIATCVLSILLCSIYIFFRQWIATTDFKQLAEKRISRLLNANVKVGQVRVGVLPNISLSRFEITQPQPRPSALVSIKRIVLHYGFFNLFNSDWAVPSTIVLDSPRFQFQPLVSSQNLFDISSQWHKKFDFGRLELKGGEFVFFVQGFAREFKVEQVSGAVRFDSLKRIHVDFHARVGGVAEGEIDVAGWIQPWEKMGELNIALKDVHLRPEMKIPLSHMNGTIALSGSEILLKNIRCELKGMPVEISGKAGSVFSSLSHLDLSGRLMESKEPFGADLHIDIPKGTIEGDWLMWGRPYRFQGNISSTGSAIKLSQLSFDNGFMAEGIFDLKASRYDFKAEREKQRFLFGLSLNNLAMDLNFDFNHLSAGGHDITAFAYMKMRPIENDWESGRHRFEAQVKTDYFIFDFHPLHDFSAEFQATPFGFDSLVARWGGFSELRGSGTFSLPAHLNLTLSVNQFNLSDFKFMGSHQMPSSLEGMIGGKVDILGSIQKPELKGRFSIQTGKIGKLGFDDAVINFYGVSPYLQLTNSQLTIKGRTFQLKGAVNFKLKNIFQEVQAVSIGNLIVWRGIDISREFKEGEAAEFANANSATVPRAGNAGGNGQLRQSRVSADYSLKKGKSIGVAAEEEDNGQTLVTVGPKVKF